MNFNTVDIFSITHHRLPEFRLRRGDTCLLLVDWQYLDAHPDHGMIAAARESTGDEAVRYTVARLRSSIPNARRLLEAFRSKGWEVIHVKIESLTRDGRERSLHHKNLGIHAPPGSKEAQVLAELAPSEDEIVLSKTCSSAFNGTMLNYILRNIGISTLVITGVRTGGCVEATIRDAANLGYRVILVEDACVDIAEARHLAALEALADNYCQVSSTDDILKQLEADDSQLAAPSAAS